MKFCALVGKENVKKYLSVKALFVGAFVAAVFRHVSFIMNTVCIYDKIGFSDSYLRFLWKKNCDVTRNQIQTSDHCILTCRLRSRTKQEVSEGTNGIDQFGFHSTIMNKR